MWTQAEAASYPRSLEKQAPVSQLVFVGLILSISDCLFVCLSVSACQCDTGRWIERPTNRHMHTQTQTDTDRHRQTQTNISRQFEIDWLSLTLTDTVIHT